MINIRRRPRRLPQCPARWWLTESRRDRLCGRMAKWEIIRRDCEQLKVFFLGPSQYWVSLPPSVEWLPGFLVLQAGIPPTFHQMPQYPEVIHTHTRGTHSAAAHNPDTHTSLFLVLLPAHTGFPSTGCYSLLTRFGFWGGSPKLCEASHNDSVKGMNKTCLAAVEKWPFPLNPTITGPFPMLTILTFSFWQWPKFYIHKNAAKLPVKRFN